MRLCSAVDDPQPQAGGPARARAQALALVALGSNVGCREAHLLAGLAGLAALPGTSLLARSRFLETAPVGGPPQDSYLNAAALLRTGLDPRELLEHMQRIEVDRGRDRATELRWGPRTLDLDLIAHGDARLDEPGLTIPHPRATERLFVLEPAAEVAPDLPLPGLGTVAGALAALRARTAAALPPVASDV